MHSKSWANAQPQLIHSVALLVAAQNQNPISGVLFTTGMTMFSGSLYALVLDPARFRFLGPVTPLGGLCCSFPLSYVSPCTGISISIYQHVYLLCIQVSFYVKYNCNVLYAPTLT